MLRKTQLFGQNPIETYWWLCIFTGVHCDIQLLMD